MSKENFYLKKSEYVKKINETFRPLINFGEATYVYIYQTENEYLRIRDTVGGAKFLNVTGFDLERILIDVLIIIAGQKPKSLIEPLEERRQVATIFEKGDRL